MKTLVEFRSDKFPPFNNEQEEINPGIWGRRLAEYLSTELKEKGIPIRDPIAEDWGYYVEIENKEFRLAVCCGHLYGENDEFLCFTEPKTPTIKKFFKKIDASAQLRRLIEAIDEVLSSDPEIWDIKWKEEE